MSRRPGSCLAVACALGLAGLSASAAALPVPIGRHVQVPHGISPDHAWIGHRADARRSGRSRYAAPKEAPTLAWETRVGVGSASTPAVTADGISYTVTSSGVTALEPSGDVRWARRLRFLLGTPSLLPGGDVLVVSRDGALLRFTPDGEPGRPSPSLPSIAAPVLVLSDGSVVAGTRDLAAVRVDAEGRRRFRMELSQVPGRPMAWDGADRLVVVAGSELIFLSAEGHLLARTTMSEPIVVGPALGTDGTAWVVTADGQLVAFDPRGRVRARAEVGVAVSPDALAIGPDGVVRVATRERGLVCVGPGGTERWRLDSEGVFLGGLTVDPHDVTVGITAQGAMVAVEPDGTVRWRVGTYPRTTADPVLYRGGVLVGTAAGTVQAFR
jgi:outer membrane protein assembly factor BamB